MKNQTYPMLYRIKTIHDMIKAGKYPNSSDFCTDDHNTGILVSRATFNRDLRALKYDMKAPLKFDSKKNGYYYSEDYDLPFNYIDKTSAETLMCAKLLLQNYADTPFYDNLCKALNELTSINLKDAENNILDRIEVAKSLIYSKADDSLWPLLMEALEKNLVVEFDYSSKGVAEHEIAEPYEIVLDNGKTFLLAKETGTGAIRLFAVFKLQNLVLTDKTFKLPAEHTLTQINGDSRLGAFYSNRGKMKFKIEVSGETQALLSTVKFADDQKQTFDEEKNCTLYEFTSGQFELIFNYLVSFADEAKPIEPPELVEKWKSHWRDKLDKIKKIIEE